MIVFSNYGSLINKPRAGFDRSKGKIDRDRSKFIAQVRRQVNPTNQKISRPWFIHNTDGTVIVSLRKGTVNLDLGGGKKHLLINDWDGAVKFYQDVEQAAKRGEFDQLLQSVVFVRKKNNDDFIDEVNEETTNDAVTNTDDLELDEMLDEIKRRRAEPRKTNEVNENS